MGVTVQERGGVLLFEKLKIFPDSQFLSGIRY